MPIKCFWLEPLPLRRRFLRRFQWSADPQASRCSLPGGYHDASMPLDVMPYEPGTALRVDLENVDRADARWPAVCACGYVFEGSDEWQVSQEPLYRRSDSGEIITLRDAPAGAMWDAWWLAEYAQYRGPDGKSLHVRLPGGRDWCVDSRAANCTLPNDNAQNVGCATGPAVSRSLTGMAFCATATWWSASLCRAVLSSDYQLSATTAWKLTMICMTIRIPAAGFG